MLLAKNLVLASLAAWAADAPAPACHAQSAPTLTPVIELYTSEGCSSCPPADRWLSTLKTAAAQGRVVAHAFHVGYWDYIGWADRFAAPAHTQRQRHVAASNGLDHIYTPQVVRDGRDWREWRRGLLGANAPARAAIRIDRAAVDTFEALVAPAEGVAQWGAYWTVTEHGHRTRVRAGENAGESLQHDFVVRQYVHAGYYDGTQKLRLRAVPREGEHPRQVNLVVFEPKTGKPLQALSLACAG